MSRGRRTLRWVGLTVLLGATVWFLYKVFERFADMGPTLDAKQLLLPAMSMAIVVLALALAGILIRNLVRLIVDRKRGILGSRLRTKLVFFFLALILLPATVLFSGSAQVIKQTVEAILRTPMEELSRESRAMLHEWNGYFRQRSLHTAESIADEIAETDAVAPGYTAKLERLLARWQNSETTQVVRILDGTRLLAGTASDDADDALQQQLGLLMNALVEEATRTGRGVTRIDRLEPERAGLLAHAAIPVTTPDRQHRSEIVSVGLVVPPRVAANLEAIDAANRAYTQFRINRRELVRLYLTLIGLIFLVTLFIATWVGFYISGRITGPINELAAASREISAGNLGVRVRTEAGDEMAVLVDAFNEMAGELQENREVITRSTADLRRSNRALDERRRYIETLLANLSTAVISLDADGRVTTVNPATREILGVELAPGDHAGRSFSDCGLDALGELLAPELVSRDETLRRDLDLPMQSRTRNVSVQISPLHGASGESLGTLLMVDDLSELLQAQKAVAWREIAQRIAHEIKNPLTPIQLAAQRLRKKFSENSKDLERVLPEATDSIERQVGALKELVDEFSSFARMPEISTREVEFVPLLESVLALYKGLPSVQWDVEVQPEIGRVQLDPEQIRGVLINLIDNALAAMEGQGTIRIRARAPLGERLLRIEVADTGPGVPPGDRAKMFSPYFSTKKRGTGLGLAIVHRVVTDHHGTIRLESGDDCGARFVIEIPT